MKAFLTALWLVATPAQSQEAPSLPCAPSAKVEAGIAKQYGESLAAVGMATNDGVVAVLANPTTGTFTIILRRPGGLSCLVIAGKGFTLVPAEKTVPGSDL